MPNNHCNHLKCDFCGGNLISEDKPDCTLLICKKCEYQERVWKIGYHGKFDDIDYPHDNLKDYLNDNEE